MLFVFPTGIQTWYTFSCLSCPPNSESQDEVLEVKLKRNGKSTRVKSSESFSILRTASFRTEK